MSEGLQTNSPFEPLSVDFGFQWSLHWFTLYRCHEVDKCICVLYLCYLGVCSHARKNKKHKGECWSLRPLLDFWGSAVLVWHHRGTEAEHTGPEHNEVCLRPLDKRCIHNLVTVPPLALIKIFTSAGLMETSNPVFAPGVRMMTDEILKLHFFHAGEYKNIFFPHSHKVGRISCFVFCFVNWYLEKKIKKISK